MADNTENIYVAFDYNNIVIVDPNKVIDSEGRAKERYVNQENLVIYANLECSVLPRTKLAIGTPQNLDAIQTISIAEINFLNPGKKEFLDNEYLNELTGQNSTKGGAQNQNRIEKIPQKENESSYIRQTRLNQTDNGLLGITQIQVRQGLDFTPQITITLEDIKGRALFESGPNSPYGAFFHLPYPPFYLTLKGYYGKAIRLTLMLTKFNARYDSLSGNFKVQLDFLTYKYSVLVEVPMGHVLAVPYMYPTPYKQETTQGSNTTRVLNFTSEIGRQKLKEVYTEYISKKLIPENFQPYTIKDLYEILSRFIKDTLNGYIETNLQPLTDIDDFEKNLGRYEGEVYSFGVDTKTKLGAWFELYIDKKNYYITTKGEKIYYVKKGFVPEEVEAQLVSIIDEFNTRLNSNKTCGQIGGSYKRQSVNPNGKTVPINSKVPNSIDINVFKINRKIEENDINANETVKKRRNIQNPTNFEEDFITQQFKFDQVDKGTRKLNKLTGEWDPPIVTWYIFEGDGRFLSLINEMKNKVQTIKGQIQDDITIALSEYLQQQKTIGFVPNIRNVLAILFANAEAFLRLMEGVHDKAWALNKDKNRINTILGDNSVSADKQPDGEQIIYPWPQLVVRNEIKDRVEYKLDYPGNVEIKDQTKANNYDVWPEVEFVEEYINALVNKVSRDTSTTQIANEVNDISRISINAIEFPITNEVYFNQEIVKFFYEIFERINYTIYYSRINRENPTFLYQLITEIEATNIRESLSSGAPELIIALQSVNGLNGQNYTNTLKEISNNGSGISWNTWISGIYNTIYINNRVSSSFAIRPDFFMNKVKTKPQIAIGNQIQEDLQTWLTGSTKNNQITFTDTYPFTNDTWIKSSLANGITTNSKNSFDTTNSIFYEINYRTITNFLKKDTYTTNRPITYFNFKKPITTNIPSYDNLTNYYTNIVDDYKKQTVTEGNLTYSSFYSGNVATKQTTSILNTPYFVNAIQKGVELEKAKSVYPYVKAAYLFINGLPLITGREKVKNFENDIQTDGKYIYALLKKYGAIHKLPYAWLLKIGSVWHRYKKNINENVDILTDVWNDFDYTKNYDPSGNTIDRKYTFTASSISYNVFLQKDVTTSGDTVTQINLGFYPKLINDFSYFYLGKNVIGGNLDNNDIQRALDGKTLNLIKSDSASFLYNKGFDSSNLNRSISVSSWSSYLSGDTIGIYLLPSVGGINQTRMECFNNPLVPASTKLKIELKNNKAMYNGSVRNFWLTSNFGYFDNSLVNKPSTTQYIKKIFNDKNEQVNFSIGSSTSDYSTIEELFSLFDTKILDSFEEEFLNFSKADTNFNTSLVENKSSSKNSYYNFQLLMKNMMKFKFDTVDQNTNQTSDNGVSPELITSLAKKQANIINSFLEGFLQEDIYFVYGNPSNYNKKLFYSFSDLPMEGKFSWKGYTETTPNSLPPTISVVNSKIQYPNEWKTLQNYVGFSTITELEYKDTGSFITDFFIDFNIAFNETNIKNFAPIIKLYATQRLNQTQSNNVNTNQTPNANLLLYVANLNDGSIIEITQNTSNKILTKKLSNIPQFTKSYPLTDSVDSIINDFKALSAFSTLQVVSSTNYQPNNTFPNTTNSSVSNTGYQVFKDNLTNYLNANESDISQIISLFWPDMTKQLSNIDREPKKPDKSQLNGDPQTKLELWNLFKALNDKWIAGNDYTTKTLFEDVMLVDRASRNIGDDVLVDIFGLKELLDPTKINLKADVIAYAENILKMNNFEIMTLPSYVNFYGVQNVSANPQPPAEGTLDFANTLFGTFLEVDYRESSSKLVCMFVDRPSEYIDLKDNVDFRFNDDSFDITRASDHPLSESLQNKTDFDKSNKVVGFNVDIGVQNQQIFKNFSVGQNSGIATAEALEVINQMALQGGHRSVATQNMSLYSLYKNRSYTCNLSMMGNAIVQPTMYFNLRYVPMFSGPYMITEVNHSISPGEFSTDIVGVRQPIATLPILTNFLQSLKNNLIKEIDTKVDVYSKASVNAKPTNVIGETQVAGARNKDTKTTQPNPDCKTSVAAYNTYSIVEFIDEQTTKTAKEMIDSIYKSMIEANTANNVKLAKVIFSYFYFNNGTSNSTFTADYNNYGGVDLLQDWNAKSRYFELTPQFFCKTSNTPSANNSSTVATKITPYAVFGTVDLHTIFFVEWWKTRVNSLDISGTIDQSTENIVKFIVQNRDPLKINSDGFYESFKTNDKASYDIMIKSVKSALELFDRTI